MRRTASEVIRDLETRIARLEGEANHKTTGSTLTMVAKTFLRELSQGRGVRVTVRDVEEALADFLGGEFEELFDDDEDARGATVKIKRITAVNSGDMYEDPSLTATISVSGSVGMDPDVEIDFYLIHGTTPSFFLVD